MNAEQRALALDNIGIVRAIAVKLVRGPLRSLPIDDLVSYGTIGLCEAAERWRPGSPVAFVNYAWTRIRGAMIDGARQMGLSRGRIEAFRNHGDETTLLGGGSLLGLHDGGSGAETMETRALVGRLLTALPANEAAAVLSHGARVSGNTATARARRWREERRGMAKLRALMGVAA